MAQWDNLKLISVMSRVLLILVLIFHLVFIKNLLNDKSKYNIKIVHNFYYPGPTCYL